MNTLVSTLHACVCVCAMVVLTAIRDEVFSVLTLDLEVYTIADFKKGVQKA